MSTSSKIWTVLFLIIGLIGCIASTIHDNLFYMGFSSMTLAMSIASYDSMNKKSEE